MKKGIPGIIRWSVVSFALISNLLWIQHPVSAQQYRWIDLTANLPDTSLFGGLGKVIFRGENGWITQGWYTLPREIYYTSDGGETFSIQSLPDDAGTVGDICIRANFEGYIVTCWDDAGNSGKIFHSDDAREGNWTLLNEVNGSGFYSIAFPPLPFSTGYLGSAAGDVWKINGTSVTFDGWCNTNYDVMGMSFPVNADTGWAATSGIEHREASGWIMSGQNFQGDGLSAVWFYDNNNGWICGSNRMIEHTTDGHNWIIQLSGNSRQLYGIAFSDLMNGWSVGAGSIFHTTNGGVQWVDESSQMDADDIELKSVSVVNSHTAYAAGERRSTLTPVFLKYMAVSGEVGLQNNTVEVFPDPAVNEVELICRIPVKNHAEVKVISSSGILVKTKTLYFVNNKARIDVKDLVPGIYLLRFSFGQEAFSAKMIKQ